MATTTQVYLLFDERMALHRPVFNPDNPDYFPFENPDRIFRVYQRLLDVEKRLAQKSKNPSVQGILPCDGPRFVEFRCRPVDRKTVELTHAPDHYDWLYSTMFMSDAELRGLADPDDLFVCQSTFLASSLACGGVVQCVDAVTSNETFASGNRITRAIALVRPPGHHATKDEAMGESTSFLVHCQQL
jgi:histone deacetylase 6